MSKREAPKDDAADGNAPLLSKRRRKTEAEKLADELARGQLQDSRRQSAPKIFYGDGAGLTNWGNLVKEVMKEQTDPVSISQIAALVTAKLDPEDPRHDEGFMLTRRVIMSGLRRGAYRRRLVSINAVERAVIAEKPEHSRERTLVALSFLTLAAIQVDAAGTGAWDVVPADDDGEDFFDIEKQFECEKGCG